MMGEFMDRHVPYQISQGDVSFSEFSQYGLSEQPDDIGAHWRIKDRFFRQGDAIVKPGDFVSLGFGVLCRIKQVIGQPICDLNGNVLGQCAKGRRQRVACLQRNPFDIRKAWCCYPHGEDMDIRAAL